jgi:hypothetical protein
MLIAADVGVNLAPNGAPVVSRVIPLMNNRPFYFDPLAVFHIPNADDPSRQAATISSGRSAVQYGKPSYRSSPFCTSTSPGLSPSSGEGSVDQPFLPHCGDIIYHDLCRDTAR